MTSSPLSPRAATATLMSVGVAAPFPAPGMLPARVGLAATSENAPRGGGHFFVCDFSCSTWYHDLASHRQRLAPVGK